MITVLLAAFPATAELLWGIPRPFVSSFRTSTQEQTCSLPLPLVLSIKPNAWNSQAPSEEVASMSECSHPVYTDIFYYYHYHYCCYYYCLCTSMEVSGQLCGVGSHILLLVWVIGTGVRLASLCHLSTVLLLAEPSFHLAHEISISYVILSPLKTYSQSQCVFGMVRE